MKYTVPEEYQTQFNTLIRSVPVELQDDDEFKETLLVYLKMGGIGLARHYAETTAKYLDVDVLEIGTGLRFPKVAEVKQEDENDDDNEENNDDDNEEDNDDDNDEDNDQDNETAEEEKSE
jgi:predicted nicotinamide N-methyase